MFLLLAVLRSSSVQAPVCPPSPPSGAPAFFDFQVETPARYIADDNKLPHPDATLNQRPPFSGDFALVQFIVDTTGVPDVKSLKILRHPEGLVADSVRAAAVQWRFRPATLGGCRVPQLVQSALRWK
jgi:hypothetical protein